MKAGILFSLFLFSIFLISCNHSQDDLNEKINKLIAGHNSIDKTEWQELNSFRDKYKQKLQEAKCECLNDSSLRSYVRNYYTTATRKSSSELKIWQEPVLGNINFYIDNSASMDGYFKKEKETEFRANITDLTGKIDETFKPKPTNIWLITDSIIGPIAPQKFSSEMVLKRIANKDGYQLQDMISKIVSKSEPNDLTILVSDFILSYPDAEIKSNPEINKINAPTDLRAKVYSTFSELKKKGLATSIYAFNSKFYGTYYNYQNGKTDFSKQGTNRPYYIMMIANEELLKNFNAKLSEISTFIPEKILHFGFIDEPITEYKIIPQIERKGKWMPLKSGIEEIQMQENELPQFCVAINLSEIPEYAKDIKFLNENKKISSTGCEVECELKNKSNLDKSKLRSEPQIATLEKCTHGIIVKVKSMNLPEAQIHVTVPLKYDEWYLLWSCDDDKNLDSARNRTFAFKYFIDGIKDAYENKNNNYIDLMLTLKK